MELMSCRAFRAWRGQGQGQVKGLAEGKGREGHCSCWCQCQTIDSGFRSGQGKWPGEGVRGQESGHLLLDA